MTIAQFKAYVVSVGAILDEASEAQSETYIVDAPAGKRWRGNGGHAVIEVFGNGQQAWRMQAIKSAVATMSYGLEDCDTGCETCAERAEEDALKGKY